MLLHSCNKHFRFLSRGIVFCHCWSVGFPGCVYFKLPGLHKKHDTVWMIKEAIECGHENVMGGDLEAEREGFELNKMLKS